MSSSIIIKLLKKLLIPYIKTVCPLSPHLAGISPPGASFWTSTSVLRSVMVWSKSSTRRGPWPPEVMASSVTLIHKIASIIQLPKTFYAALERVRLIIQYTTSSFSLNLLLCGYLTQNVIKSCVYNFYED